MQFSMCQEIYLNETSLINELLSSQTYYVAIMLISDFGIRIILPEAVKLILSLSSSSVILITL